ncbi:MAG: Ig-like domain-containing protein, partial [Bacteroidota bacterium]|nr:Ig-like domain-containing protein [Bacteroidota bacterium]
MCIDRKTLWVIAISLLLSYESSFSQSTFTAVADGNWNSNTTWGTGVGIFPGTLDSVNIPAGRTVTIANNRNETCAALNLNSNSGSANTSLVFSTSTSTLNVSRNVLVIGPSANATTINLNIGAGSMTVTQNLTLRAASGGADTRRAKITISSGTLSINRDFIFENTISNARIIVDAGTGRINLYRIFSAAGDSSKGTLTSGNGSIFNYTATVPQTVRMGTSFQYHHIYLNNTSAAGATLGGMVSTSNVTGDIRIQTGRFNNAGYDIAGTLSKTFEVANGTTFSLTGETSLPTSWNLSIGSTSTIIYGGRNQTISHLSGGYGNLELRSDSAIATKTFPATPLTVRGNFTIAKGIGTATVANASSSLTINGNINIGVNTTFNAGNFTHSIGGNLVRIGTFTHNNSTITFNGTSPQTIDPTTFYNLTIANTGSTVTLNGNINLTNNFSLNSGNFSTGSDRQLIVNGNLSINSGAFYANGSDIIVSGNWVNQGSFIAGTSTVTLNKSQSFGNTSFYNLILNNSSGFSLNANINVSNNINLNNGNLTTQSYFLQLGENANLIESTSNKIIGKVSTTRTLDSYNSFGGIGLEINPLGSAAGSTFVIRYTGTSIGGGGNQSILRYFDITPTNNSGLGATLTFYYRDDELNGNTENQLKLWKSTLGSGFANQGGVVDIDNNKVSLTGVNSFSRWTGSSNTLNYPPNAVNDNASTNEDTYVDIDVIANDTDPDNPNNELLVYQTGSPINGTIELRPDGRTVRFLPNLNLNSVNTPGGFSFTYKAKDPNNDNSNFATVSINVSPVNDPPVAYDTTITVAED